MTRMIARSTAIAGSAAIGKRRSAATSNDTVDGVLTAPYWRLVSALWQSLAHSRHISAHSWQWPWSCRAHSSAHSAQTRAQVSSINPRTSAFCPVRRTARRPVTVQMSAQSRQDRMHCRMSIFSATQASAQDVHISAQNIAWRAALASSSLKSSPTSVKCDHGVKRHQPWPCLRRFSQPFFAAAERFSALWLEPPIRPPLREDA